MKKNIQSLRILALVAFSAVGNLFSTALAQDTLYSLVSETLSSGDAPGRGSFIVSPTLPYVWRSPQNNDLWQGVNGTNHPCPAGYRLPTVAEINAERTSWSSNDAAGAFASPLKITLAGYRKASNAALNLVGFYGFYWSGSVHTTGAQYLNLRSNNAYTSYDSRAGGYSVRCLKDN